MSASKRTASISPVERWDETEIRCPKCGDGALWRQVLLCAVRALAGGARDYAPLREPAKDEPLPRGARRQWVEQEHVHVCARCQAEVGYLRIEIPSSFTERARGAIEEVQCR